jgi:hypothetical protein
MINRFIIFASLAALSAVEFPVWCGPSQDSQRSTLRFLVADTFGNPVAKFQYILEDTVNDFYFRGTASNTQPIDVPSGSYSLQVSAVGFEVYSARVAIQTRETIIPVGLLIGSITPVKPKSSLLVSVAASNKPKRASWIKLIELYSDNTKSAQCDEKGVAHIWNLRPGKYVLLVIDSFELRNMRTIELPDGETSIRID